MEFQAVFDTLKAEGLAARRYQREGRGKFRDCVTIGRNGRLLFERYNYGEAAGLVFSMWGTAGPDGVLQWEMDAVDYTDKTDAPARLTAADGDALELDGGRLWWRVAVSLKSWPAGGLGCLKMLFTK